MSKDEKSEFAIAKVLPGRLNAMVKRAMIETCISDPNLAVDAYLSGRFQLVESPAWREAHALLDPLGPINLPATTAPFVAVERLVINIGPGAPVKIRDIGGNFARWFGQVVEGPMGEQTLSRYRLRRCSLDRPIIAELGGVTRAATALTSIYGLMALQPNGEVGALLNDGWANIFYVSQAIKRLGRNGFSYTNPATDQEVCEKIDSPQYLFGANGQWYVFRAISVYWDDDGWSLYANPVEHPLEWRDGHQVFSAILESR